MITFRPFRRFASVFGAVLLAACTGAAQAAPYVMFRDPGCGCCKEWAAHVREGFAHEVAVREDDPDTILYAARNRLYLSRDGGRFWHALAPELPAIDAVAFAED